MTSRACSRFFLLLLISISALAAQSQESILPDPRGLGARIEHRQGEICVVCNKPLRTGDYVYVVEGQRVPVHTGECNAALQAEPARYLAQLKPRGGFLGASPEHGGASWLWFLAGLYVLAGLAFAALCAHTALHRGHSPAKWFAAGFFLLAFGYLALLMRPRREASAPPGLGKVHVTSEPKACPQCGAWNHPAARACHECRAALVPEAVSEVGRA